MMTDCHDGEYDYCGAWCVTVAMVLSGAIRRPLRPFAYRPHTPSVMRAIRRGCYGHQHRRAQQL
jgi:hypothetical protein